MSYETSQNVATSRRVSNSLIYLTPVYLFLSFHMMSPLSLGQSVKSGGNASSVDPVKRQVLAPALKMLKTRGVPFDTQLLLDDDWRALIGPALVLMPEMGQTLRVTEPMGGVYLSGTVLLPEHITLKSNTLILTRELASDDENSAINITGSHRLVIFNLSDNRKLEAMVRHRPTQFLNIDVEAPCALVGIPPMYLRTYRWRGQGYFGGWKKLL